MPPKHPVVRAIEPVTDPNMRQNKVSVSIAIESGFVETADELISDGVFKTISLALI